MQLGRDRPDPLSMPLGRRTGPAGPARPARAVGLDRSPIERLGSGLSLDRPPCLPIEDIVDCQDSGLPLRFANVAPAVSSLAAWVMIRLADSESRMKICWTFRTVSPGRS